MEYISDQVKFPLSPQISTFHVLKLFFYFLAYLFFVVKSFFEVTDCVEGSTQNVFFAQK